MALALPLSLQHLEHKLKLVPAESVRALQGVGAPTGWPELDALLEGRALPKGVVELVAHGGLSGATAIALSCVRGVQRALPRTWCAWVDSEQSLYAPGVAMSGVALSRLLVVRPRPDQVLRTALRLVRAGAFEMVVVDAEPASIVQAAGAHIALENTARKLALYAEEAGVSVVLLTHAGRARRAPLTATMRIELRRSQLHVDARVVREKSGYGGRDAQLVWAHRPHELYT